MGSSSSKSGSKRRPASSPTVSSPPPSSGSTLAKSQAPSSPAVAVSTPTTKAAAGSRKVTRKPEVESFNPKHAADFFAKYREKDEDHISPEGLTRLCADWGVEAEDVVLLVVSFYMGAREQGYWSQEEFLTGMKKLDVDSLSKLKEKTQSIRDRVHADPHVFKEFYRYAFTFAKESDKKIVDMETAIAVLTMVLPADTPHLKSFIAFLSDQSSYRALNLDQWMSFLEWTRTVDPDLGNYDSDSAWPVIMDSYCEWLADSRNK